MKILLSYEPGGTETLKLADAPDPKPAPGEVVIDVKAVGLNFPDSLIIRDQYQTKPLRPFAPGSELAGVISALGERVTEVKVGDRVIARPGHGGMTEKIAVKADDCFAMPDGMSFEDAGAAFLLTYGTSYHALKQCAEIKPGETLLVLGAAGGVGIAAIELGKAMGARVVAAVSSQDKLDFAMQSGADEGFVYPRGPFEPGDARMLSGVFKDNLGERGCDVIYDPVGGAYAEASLRSINWDGRFLVVGFPAGIPRIPLNLPLLKGGKICGVFVGGFSAARPAQNKQNNLELLDLYAQGKIKPRISERFPLARGGEAIERLAAREAKGKIVVTIGN